MGKTVKLTGLQLVVKNNVFGVIQNCAIQIAGKPIFAPDIRNVNGYYAEVDEIGHEHFGDVITDSDRHQHFKD